MSNNHGPNFETNTANTVKSNEAGIYTLAQIKEGKYSLRAQAAGFKECAP